MAIRRDHILRLIERAGPMLKRILGLKKAEEKRQAQQLIAESCRELLGLDFGLLASMPAEGVLQLLTIDEGSAPARCLVASELLRAHAALVEGSDAPGAAELRRRADRLRDWTASKPGGAEAIGELGWRKDG